MNSGLGSCAQFRVSKGAAVSALVAVIGISDGSVGRSVAFSVLVAAVGISDELAGRSTAVPALVFTPGISEESAGRSSCCWVWLPTGVTASAYVLSRVGA